MVFDRAEAGAERRFDDTERVGNFSILIRLACETNRGRQARRSAGALARARAGEHRKSTAELPSARLLASPSVRSERRTANPFADSLSEALTSVWSMQISRSSFFKFRMGKHPAFHARI